LEWRVDKSPSFSILKIRLGPGESVTAEPGAMVLMRGPLEIKTHTGGVGRAILRALAGGESVWLNTFAARGDAELWLAPPIPGDIAYVEIGGTPLIVQDTSYLAHHGDIKVGVAWRGFRGLLAEGQLVWLKLEGVGGAWLNSYGGVEVLELKAGERVIVDNFHFIAMTEGAKWRVRKFGGLKSFLLGGEGIVIEIEGPTKLYLQTRSLQPFAAVLSRFIRRK